MDIYLTSDLHLCHDKPFLYEPRGFSTPEEHADTIIQNINNIVNKDDILYLLGDLVLSNTDQGIEYLKQIKCKNIYFIRGNHDTDAKVQRYINDVGLLCLGYADIIKVNKFRFYLSHYPTITCNFGDKHKPSQRLYNLCGHSHIVDKFDPITGSYHVELDAHNNMPVNILTIIDEVKANGTNLL